jgi:hypothetical protein
MLIISMLPEYQMGYHLCMYHDELDMRQTNTKKGTFILSSSMAK